MVFSLALNFIILSLHIRLSIYLNLYILFSLPINHDLRTLMILANEKQAHYNFYIAERIPLGKEIYADWPTLNSLRLVASYRINILVPKAERTPNIEFALHADNGVEIKISNIWNR